MVAPRLPLGSVLRWQRARIRIGCEGYSFSTILNYPARSEDMSALDGRIALVTGSSAIQVEADVTRLGEIEAMRERVERELEPIDILVANAGGNPVPPGPLEEISEAGWHASVDANLTATFLTIKSVLPGMKARRGGTIITVSSAAGRRPHPRSPVPYAAAKAGIQMLTQHLAAQAGPFGIRVNCIAPETILTERNLGQIPRLSGRRSSSSTRCDGWAHRRTSRRPRCSSPPTPPGGSPASSLMWRGER
jgi:NAD(P)-dependent dehydrogenase (short-subunit alcohol dehydrogenase family)